MRRFSQKLLGGAGAFSVASVLATVVAHAQTATPYYDDYVYATTAADTAFLGGFTLMYVCFCCVAILVPIACAVIVYKDAMKFKIDNAVLWAVLAFFFPIIGLLVYFLAIKPDAVRKQGGSHPTETK